MHATGVAARRLPGPPGVHHLRSLDDARALAADADAVEPRGRRRRGLHRRRGRLDARAQVGSVTVVEPLAAPLERVLGPEVGGLLAARYAAHGVDLRLGIGVEGFDGDDRVRAVRLSDGTVLARRRRRGRDRHGRRDDRGRLVRPHVDAGRVRVRRRRLAGGGPRTAGTCASSTGRAPPGRPARSPRRSPASSAPYDESPYFWSDQFGLRLQHVGHAETWDAVRARRRRRPSSPRATSTRTGRLLSALAANRASELRTLRLELAA